MPTGKMADCIDVNFGSFDKFKAEFSKKALTNFGSGWTWLVQKPDCSMEVVNTKNADTPLKGEDSHPILNIDVWEHAYYIDYRNSRPNYVKNFWNLINWDFAEKNILPQC